MRKAGRLIFAHNAESKDQARNLLRLRSCFVVVKQKYSKHGRIRTTCSTLKPKLSSNHRSMLMKKLDSFTNPLPLPQVLLVLKTRDFLVRKEQGGKIYFDFVCDCMYSVAYSDYIVRGSRKTLPGTRTCSYSLFTGPLDCEQVQGEIVIILTH